jgi:pilus assembly protein CpaF
VVDSLRLHDLRPGLLDGRIQGGTVARKDKVTFGDRPALPEHMLSLRAKIHQRVLQEMDAETLRSATRSGSDRDEVQRRAQQAMLATLTEDGIQVVPSLRNILLAEVMDELLGYGPIQPLLDDPAITEVVVNAPREVFAEKAGRLRRTDRMFNDNAHVLRIINKIVAPLGRRVDESSPMVDARLPDGSRVNIVVPPVALRGPAITIRKFSRIPFTVHDLIQKGTLTEPMATFLRACVEARLNMLISGGTGSGKTTTLNVLSSFIPDHERVVTIEDAAELQLHQEDLVALEARPGTVEGKCAVTIRDLVRNSLRMRPDRIVVGEVRGGESLDMLQAMNTGHDGSLSTIHANSPRDALARLETLTLMSGVDLPMRAITKQIASAIQVIVQQGRLQDGTRKVTHITEVHGMEGDTVLLQDIFVFEQTGVSPDGRVIGEHRPTGLRPRALARLEAAGIRLPPSLFLR